MTTSKLKEGEILRPDFGRKKAAPEKKAEPEKEKLKSYTVAELKKKATWLGKVVTSKRGSRRYVVTTAHFYGWGKAKDGNIGYMVAALGGGDKGSHDSSSGQDNMGQNWVVDKDQEIVFTGKHASKRNAVYASDLRKHASPSVFDAAGGNSHVVAQIPMDARATRIEDWNKIMFQSAGGRLWARLGRNRIYGYIARPSKDEQLHIHAHQKGKNTGPTTDKGEFKDLEAAKKAFKVLMKSGELDESNVARMSDIYGKDSVSLDNLSSGKKFKFSGQDGDKVHTKTGPGAYTTDGKPHKTGAKVRVIPEAVGKGKVESVNESSFKVGQWFRQRGSDFAAYGVVIADQKNGSSKAVVVTTYDYESPGKAVTKSMNGWWPEPKVIDKSKVPPKVVKKIEAKTGLSEAEGKVTGIPNVGPTKRGKCDKCGVHDPMLIKGKCSHCRREGWPSMKDKKMGEAVSLVRTRGVTGLTESQPWLEVDKKRDPFDIMREECNAIVAEEEAKDSLAQLALNRNLDMQSLKDLEMHTASPRFKNALHALKRKIDTLTPEQQKKVKAAAQRIYGESVTEATDISQGRFDHLRKTGKDALDKLRKPRKGLTVRRQDQDGTTRTVNVTVPQKESAKSFSADDARKMGAAAFAAGKMQAPALNQEFLSNLKGLPIGGGSLKLMTAYINGWDKANLAAPVKESAQSLSISRRLDEGKEPAKGQKLRYTDDDGDKHNVIFVRKLPTGWYQVKRANFPDGDDMNGVWYVKPEQVKEAKPSTLSRTLSESLRGAR